jgi:mono/diheme cytochrome c family protein
MGKSGGPARHSSAEKVITMRWAHIAFFLVAVCAATVASCAQESYPPALLHSTSPVVAAAAPKECQQAESEGLPQRLVAMTASSGASSTTTVHVSDLFNDFNSGGLCGGCHGSTASQGGFQIPTAAQFPSLMTSSVIAHVLSNGGASDPEIMPPVGLGGEPYSQRAESDPIKQFAELVSQWLAAGSPQAFQTTIGVASAVGSTDNVSYIMTPDIGDSMTNLGSCIPTPALVGSEMQQSLALDAMFAQSMAQMPQAGQPSPAPNEMLGLPVHLSETDLVSLDSSVLAQYGVIAYAPGYPLWSDNSGKMRYIRVPRGTSIHFNKDTQQFEIPPNTRFYKTFMRQIIDTDGSIRWRKIETRLIVSRPDLVDGQGNHTQTALFGTYKWTDDESDAVLVQSLQNDLLPFPDTLFLYNTNEPLAADILNGQPLNPEEALIEADAARHYAIPGSQRCTECHMGSPSAGFVLGFTPLQIARRPPGEGGVIEPTGPDELTQLQRFIDYGLVTGINSQADVVPLEQSQGTRTPRNNQELVAQGYLLGNCAHCHNPIGFPTVQNPVLKEVLDFLPNSGPVGGIFQLSLEAMSPRIFRGYGGTTPIPYITPSLMDLPRFDSGGNPLLDIFASVGVFGPWRSLIFRNVEDAFPYTDDGALYPHMPFNTAGYDPRAKQILADWMVSIPAVRKHPELNEYTFVTGSNSSSTDQSAATNATLDTSPQPYVEVLPGSVGYSEAVLAAQQRLAILHTGVNPALPSQSIYSRYLDPDETADILDPQVVADPVCHPAPEPDIVAGDPYPEARHPHWVVTDLTSPAGPWLPRRTDWASILVDGETPPLPNSCTPAAAQVAARQDQLDAIGLLQTISLEGLRSFATTPVPFGLWAPNAACDFSSPTVQDPSSWPLAAPPVSAFSPAPHWVSVANPSPDAPVYMQTPGEAVFRMICINCHGPKGDGQGRMASNLATITGGLARVADFHDGLFGPVTSPGADIESVFGAPLPSFDAGVDTAQAFNAADAMADADAGPSVGPADWTGISAEERAARYMPWMALGGTLVSIPPAILALVAQTKVLDQPRALSASSLSANMLSQAKALCFSLLGNNNSTVLNQFDPSGGYLKAVRGALSGVFTPTTNFNLLAYNGDAELWLQLCSLNNPPPVHVLDYVSGQLQERENVSSTGVPDVAKEIAAIPASNFSGGVAPGTSCGAGWVGNDRGGCDHCLSGTPGCDVTTPNLWPWCVAPLAPDYSNANGAFAPPPGTPICPDFGGAAASTWSMTDAQANQWAVRGAINAGQSVFLYLEWLEKQAAPPPDYTQCQQLP